MKLLFVELPIICSLGDSSWSVLPDVPPVELLARADIARQRGAAVEIIPAPCGDLDLAAGSGAIASFAETLAKHSADTIFLFANVFQWPAASRLARSLAKLGVRQDRIVIVGNLPGSIQRFREDFVLAAEAQYFALIDDRELPFPAGRILAWPGRGRAISLADTNGFPLDAQLHLWNVPESRLCSIPDDDTIISDLAAAHKDQQLTIGLRQPAFGWEERGVDFLGSLALRALRDHDALIRYHVRITPDELLRRSVLPSLGLLEPERIDLLAGSGSEATLRRANAPFDSDVIEQCVVEIARAGLSPVTRLVFVMGLPEETPEQALETVQFAARIARLAGMTRIRFEWWYDVPASPTYRALPEWEALLGDDSSSWFLRDDLWRSSASILDESCRTSITEAVEFIGLLNDLEIVGPNIFLGAPVSSEAS